MTFIEPDKLRLAESTDDLLAARNDANLMRSRLRGLFNIRLFLLTQRHTDAERAKYLNDTLALLPPRDGLPGWLYDLLDEAFQELGYLGMTVAEMYSRDTATQTAYNALTAAIDSLDVELARRADDPLGRTVVIAYQTQSINDNRMW